MLVTGAGRKRLPPLIEQMRCPKDSFLSELRKLLLAREGELIEDHFMILDHFLKLDLRA